MASRFAQKISSIGLNTAEVALGRTHVPKFIAGFNLDYVVKIVPRHVNKTLSIYYVMSDRIEEMNFGEKTEEYSEFMLYLNSQKMGELSKSLGDIKNYIGSNNE
jgi:hypothetical protein